MSRSDRNNNPHNYLSEQDELLQINSNTRQRNRLIGSGHMKEIMQLQEVLLKTIIKAKDVEIKKGLRSCKDRIDELYNVGKSHPLYFKLDDENQWFVDYVSIYIMEISDTAVNSSIEPQCPANTSIGASSSHSLFSAPASDNKSSSESASKHEYEYNCKP